jgi:N-hydroxyarylamine O-acetyltransferase
MYKLSELATKYLGYLKLQPEPPSYDFLDKICLAQLTTFPFENISKLIYFRDSKINRFVNPPIEVFVKNYDEYHFGGTCYSLNSNLMWLLKELGFDCYHIKLGNEHIGIIVRIDNERFYVDCGAAAPFFRPVRFERDFDNLSQFANDKVQLIPVDPDKYEYEYVRHTNGNQNGERWRFNSRQVHDITDFNKVIEESNEPGATFMTILRCQLWQPDKKRSVSLVNNQLGIRFLNGEITKRTLTSVREIEEAIKEEFLLPNMPVAEAIDVLADLGIDIFLKESN